MRKPNKNSIKDKILFIYIVVILTSALGFFAVSQLQRGIVGYENTIRHLDAGNDLKNYLNSLERVSTDDIQRMIIVLQDIRQRPQACIDQKRWLISTSFDIFARQSPFTICQNTIDLIDVAILTISSFEAGEISEQQLLTQLRYQALLIHDQAFKLKPLISKIVDVLMIMTLLIISLKALATIIVTRFSSRSIYAQFAKIAEVEHDLRQRNGELEKALSNYEQQKQQKDAIAEMQKLDQHKSMHDQLTGLPNRRYLEQKLQQWVQNNQKIAIFQIDIDHFKKINDRYGHVFGDRVLSTVAERLNAIIAESENEYVAARVGGDELFVIAPSLPAYGQRDLMDNFASKLVYSVGKPVEENEIHCPLNISVGAACVSDDADFEENFQPVYHKADLALYRAKTQGRNRHVIYDETLDAKIQAEQALRHDLARAIEDDQFVAYFQPQISRLSHDICGLEVLARWQHPTKGLLYPGAFMGIARDMGLIADIDKIIFEKALAAFHDLHDKGHHIARFSINLSKERLSDPHLIEDLASYDFKPGQIAFEMSEHVFAENSIEEMAPLMEQLRALGIELELDDFGLEQASLVHLTKLKPKRLKIDRQLLESTYFHQDQIELLSAIVAVAKMLDLEIVASNVEFEQQMQVLKPLRCDILQGQYFGEPMHQADL